MNRTQMMPLRPARRFEPRLLAAALGGALLAAPLAAGAEGGDTTKAWQWDGSYKADLLHSAHADGAVGNLGLRLHADAGALFGWDDTTLHGELLWNHGSKPNRRVGTTQGISNLEVAENSARLYASWIEHEFRASGSSLLFGLYDLNSEFYATDASGLLIHPSFGIGIDFAQSGRNGPSIFPNLGLALRGRQQFGTGYYVQAAVIDGVPGDPEHPGRTTVRLRGEDGALLVAEAGWQQRGEGDAAGPGHWGIGAWHYTQRTDRIDAGGSEHNQGIYALAQGLLFDAPARTTGFVRAGLANRRVNAVDAAVDAGVLVDRPFGDRGPTAFTAGLAIARYGRAQREAQAAAGVAARAFEAALEVGARWQASAAIAVQPLVQQVWNAGGRAGANETIVGVRLEWAFGAANP